MFIFGILSDYLKVAKVIPVFKKVDQQECNNYGPTFLLYNISKLIEKLLYTRLPLLFFRTKQLLFNYQFGFWNNHSTNHALISRTEKLQKDKDDGTFISGVFLDFQKLFDTVIHQIQISKLKNYGVRGVPFKLFRIYLENREQFVSVKNINPDILPIECSVPQGLVLALLLFLIYINEFNNAVEFSDVNHLADNTNFLYSSKCLKDINRKINLDLKNIVV